MEQFEVIQTELYKNQNLLEELEVEMRQNQSRFEAKMNELFYKKNHLKNIIDEKFQVSKQYLSCLKSDITEDFVALQKLFDSYSDSIASSFARHSLRLEEQYKKSSKDYKMQKLQVEEIIKQLYREKNKLENKNVEGE